MAEFFFVLVGILPYDTRRHRPLSHCDDLRLEGARAAVSE